jgi:hypothetical protein
MMERFTKLTSLLFCTALSATPPLPVEAAEPTAVPMEYIAVYEVLRNDKTMAEVTIQLSQEDDTWTLHGFTHDMQGLADVLNVKGVQTVTGQWQDGRFMPEKYDFSFSLVGYKSSWHAKFDWPSRIVTTRSKSGKKQLPLAGGAVDPFSLFLNISSYLAEKQPQIAVEVVDEDEIENHVYRADLEEPVQTALGCLATTRVKRIRENSKRTSMAWYANDYNYIPVQLQHFKKKGKGLEMRVISLDVAGLAVQPVGSCENDDSESRQASLG